MATFSELPGRGIITVNGADRVEFLQGLVSNDVAPVANGKPVWAALLTPQGKYRHDFFVFQRGGAFLLDCEGGDRLMDLGRALRRYVLRADVTLGMIRDESCFAVWGPGTTNVLGLAADGVLTSFGGGDAFADPRLPAMGARVFGPAATIRAALIDAGIGESDKAAWDAHRIALGVPDGARDMPVEKAILLENGFEELRGVDWGKGCYMGQELTARTKYRGLIKKRLLPVRIDGPAPDEGTQILTDGKDAGTLYSVAGDRGLALLRLERFRAGAPLVAGEAVLTAEVPDWAALPE
jgi:folate-binding protein YgfZ